MNPNDEHARRTQATPEPEKSNLLVLGVDGGTSAARALLSDSRGRIVGAGTSAGCCCYQIGGIEQCGEVLRSAVESAVKSAGSLPTRIGRATFALSGADWPEDHVVLTSLISDLALCARYEVLNDTFAVLRSGATKPYGIGLVCGSGANAAAISPAGERWAFNGYADWGGGLSLGKEIIRTVARAADGREEPTALTDGVLHALGYASVDGLLQEVWSGQFDASRLPGLAPLAFDAAAAGDGAASRLLRRQGAEMALYATALVKRFGMHDLDFEIAISGGLFAREQSALIEELISGLSSIAPGARIVRPSLPPVAGALLLSLDALAVDPQEARTNLTGSLPARWHEGSPPETREIPPAFTFPLLY